ncbi:MAG: HEAT repeat domain-containing protein, partial [Planctomycetota bacterium]
NEEVPVNRLWLLILVVLVLTPTLSAGPDWEELEEELGHGDYKHRLTAIRDLELVGGDRAAKLILRAVDDKEWDVQIRALEALGKLKCKGAFERVGRAAVEGEIILVRQAAVDALKEMEVDRAYERLLKAVRKGRAETPKIRALEAAEVLATPADAEAIAPLLLVREAKIRAAAALALGYAGNPESEKYLLKMIRDKDIRVRVSAAVGLGGVRGPKSALAMVELVLLESDPYVAERVARGLRKFEPEPTAKLLSEVAAGQRNTDRRARAVKLLANLNDPAAGPYLVDLLEDPAPTVRAWAARGIGNSGLAGGLQALRPVLTGDSNVTVRRMAFEGAMKLAADREVQAAVIRNALSTDSAEVKIRACVYVRNLGLTENLPDLHPLVSEAGWRVPTAAMITLGTLGHETEVPVLSKRVEDSDWKIRGAAVEALGQCRHMTAVPFLLDALEDRNPVVQAAGLLNLQVIAQSKRGRDVAGWRKWYEVNKDSLDLTKKGYRIEGKDDGYAKEKYLIEILNRAQIICVIGKYDHAEWVLEHLDIRHRVIRPQEILTVGLNPKQLLLINCEGTIGKKAAFEPVSWFVHVGGYIIATDWALQNTVARVFPGYVDKDSKSKTGNDVVEIEAADPDHPLIEGVFARTKKLKWWLEIIAFPMRVVDEFRVEILVDSLEMLRKYFASSMAASFDYGHGKVQTCVSHFFLQEEGLSGLTTPKARKIFAADSLGLTLKQIRKMDGLRFFDGQITEAMTKEIAEDYSMFKLIVNFVWEKRKQVEQQ